MWTRAFGVGLLAWLAAGCVPEMDNIAERGSDAQAFVRVDAGPRADAEIFQEEVDAQVSIDARADAGAAANCTQGQMQSVDPLTGRCYMFFTAPLTWEGARDACAALGPSMKTHLVSITSLEEQTRARALIGLQDTWIGRTDAALEGVWLWITGELSTFTLWSLNEPNGGTTDNCAVMKAANDGQWADRTCTNTYAYLCERDP